ncbi:MAG: hypothetical protein HYV09_24410 [Deltaproteobacteria bacterium]|nr:hypothetical protein [Deltaproteobacteria bacterium]
MIAARPRPLEPRERRVLLRALGIGALVAMAFAAPATISLVRGQLAPTESRLGEAIAHAFGGVTLPILAAAVAAGVLGDGSPVRARVDRLVAAGADPRRVLLRPILLAMIAATLAGALASTLTVALLRLSLRLGAPSLLLFDMLASAWATMLGAAAWTGLAALLVARTGRPVRAWLVVAIDLVTRLVPGALAWIAPSAHVENVLGAPPPRGFVHVPVVPQLASVAALLAIAVISTAIAARRYQGTPAR